MTESLRRLLVRFIALAALVLAGDRALSALLDRAVLSSEFRMSRAFRGGEAAQVLVLGNSRGVNGLYAPELEKQAGVQVLNLAFNGMSTLIAEAVLRDYLARNTAPRVLVLEVTNVLDVHVLLDGLMCYWHHSPALSALAAERSPINYRAGQLLNLYAFNGEIPLRALYNLRRSDQDWINRYRISAALIAEARAEPDFEPDGLADNFAALGRIAALARERDVVLRLLITPYLPEYFAHIRSWGKWVERVRAAGGSQRVWDYSRADSDPNHFADRVHLNDAGGIPFAERLVRDGFLAFDGSGAAE